MEVSCFFFFFQGYRTRRGYIATQGPLPCTFDDFWRLVYEQNTNIIVMLTKLVERGRVRGGEGREGEREGKGGTGGREREGGRGREGKRREENGKGERREGKVGHESWDSR